MTSEEIEDVLALDVPARLATIDPDGYPRITPIWFVWENGAFYMTSVENKIQLRNLHRNPAASISVDIESPDSGKGYRSNRQVKGKGTARLFKDDGSWTRRITLKYLTGPEAERMADTRVAMPRLVIELPPDNLFGLAAH
jgi:nitroimidazol reductase NimA-like FMN-containing flavoprotein (pyridoxamine 5'-phosphate oxidase superfamily)